MTSLACSPTDDHDLLALVADPWTTTRKPFADAFRAACIAVAAAHDGWVDPNAVRERLLDHDGYNPRQLSALWCAASGPHGFLDVHRDRLVPITGEGSRGNGNKMLPLRRLRTSGDHTPSDVTGRAGAPFEPVGSVPLSPVRDGAT